MIFDLTFHLNVEKIYKHLIYIFINIRIDLFNSSYRNINIINVIKSKDRNICILLFH